jgi:hypothetical protein
MVSLVHTGLGSSSLVSHDLPYPPPTRKQFCTRSCSNKHTHTHVLHCFPHPPGCSPDLLMVRIRSPDGLVVGSCTSHPGVLGSIPKREEPVRDGQPSPHRPRIVVSRGTCPPISPPPTQTVCTRSCSNKHTPPREQILQ